jgi:hypothetical protein
MKVVPGTKGKYRLLIVVGWGKFLAANTGVNTGGRVVAFPDWAGKAMDERAAAIDRMMDLLISNSFTRDEPVA